MNRLAIFHPTELVGKELVDALEQRRDTWRELKLFSTLSDEIGTLTDVRGEATFIQPVEEGALDGIDAAFFCGPMAQNRAVIAELPPGTAAIVLSPDAEQEDGHPVVAVVNPETADRDEPILSPHPAVIAIAQMLHPLLQYHPREATATVLQPVSVYGKTGLDEALAQTSSLLSFSSRPEGILPAQLAFNLLPAEPIRQLPALLRTVLDSEFAIRTQILQTGVFHGYGISLYVQLDEDAGSEAVRDALAGQLSNDLSVDPELLGLIDAAGRNEVLIGPVRPAPDQPGGYWLWAVLDNLTCGGAQNALQILDAISQQTTH